VAKKLPPGLHGYPMYNHPCGAPVDEHSDYGWISRCVCDAVPIDWQRCPAVLYEEADSRGGGPPPETGGYRAKRESAALRRPHWTPLKGEDE